MNILILCEKLNYSGALLRFSRLSQTFHAANHNFYFLPTLGTELSPNTESFENIITINESKEMNWDYIMIPGAGFSDKFILNLNYFVKSIYGLRIQHILSDKHRKKRFELLNKVFKPDIVCFNNYTAWPSGSYSKFKARKFIYAQGGVDISLFTPSDIDLPFNRLNRNNNGDIHIGSQAYKNPTLLLDCLDSLPSNYILHLFGPYSQHLTQKYLSLVEAERLYLHGPLLDSKLKDFYNGMDIIIRIETNGGWSNLCAEAMACGVPLITTLPGAECFVDNLFNAFVLDDIEKSTIINSILEVANEKEKALTRSFEGRRTIEKYSWERYSKSLFDQIFSLSISPEISHSKQYHSLYKTLSKEDIKKLFTSCVGKSALVIGDIAVLDYIKLLIHGVKKVYIFTDSSPHIDSINNAVSDFNYSSYIQLFPITADFNYNQNINLFTQSDIVIYSNTVLNVKFNDFTQYILSTYYSNTDLYSSKFDVNYKNALFVRKHQKKESQAFQFISYPKSGRSVIRFALMQLGLSNEIIFHHDDFGFSGYNHNKHEFDLSKRLSIYNIASRIIYLDRNPCDVMCSLYAQVTGRFNDLYQFNGNISQFIRDEYFGANSLQQFKDMWKLLSHKFNALTITYEDFISNPHEQLSIIIKHLNFEYSDSSINRAVYHSQFNIMKKYEKLDLFELDWLATRNGFSKMRKGPKSSNIQTLSPEDLQYLNDIFIPSCKY